MALDPQVQAVLDKIRAAGNPEYWQMTPEQARDWHNRKAGLLDVKPEPVFKTSDRSIPCGGRIRSVTQFACAVQSCTYQR